MTAPEPADRAGQPTPAGPAPAGPAPAGPAPAGPAPAGPHSAGPPPGPGVTPPFPAPPDDGRSARLWTSLGVAALAVVLCCGGGVAAAVGLVVTGTDAINEKGHAAVGEYLDHVRAGRYRDAYADLCPQLRGRESADEFAARVAAEPPIAGYELREVQFPALEVPVDVTYRNGDRDTLRFNLVQDGDTGEFEVCGVNR